MLPNQLPKYTHHQVASLAWAIGSAPLLKNNIKGLELFDEERCDELFYSHEKWLADLDADPSPLIEWLDRDVQKLLGHRFESLLAFFFSNSPQFNLLHRNVLLMQDKNTRGEIDFIVEDLENHELLHIEVACKYYIGQHNTSAWRDWIGPNGHDSLMLKMEKLHQQVRIFSTVPGKIFLEENKLAQPNSMVLLKGFFFHHFSRMQHAVPPVDAHPHYNSGWYIFDHELSVFNDSISQWLVLPKTYWTCPYRFPVSQIPVLSGKEMTEKVRAEIQRTQKAQMVMQVNVEGGMVMEVSRGFVCRMEN